MNDPRKLLVLDLDETLVYATTGKPEWPPDFRLAHYIVYKRPCLDTFLRNICDHYRIGIWSSADELYITAMIEQVVPAGITVEFVWGRSKCTTKYDPVYDCYCFEKRLYKLKNKGFSLDNILLVDDSPEKTRYNYGNAIYIRPFTGDPTDVELLLLYDYLLTLKDSDNIRSMEKRGWRNRVDHHPFVSPDHQA